MTLLDAQKLQGSNEIGEDTWELFDSVEQSFGVNLGDYHDLAGISILELSQRIDGLANYPVEYSCLSLVAFNRLRQAFQNVTGAQRSSVRPIGAEIGTATIEFAAGASGAVYCVARVSSGLCACLSGPSA
jgi:hypothetical protein